MQKSMKKIFVSNKCVACGVCTVNSEFLVEDANGCAIPKEPGLITAEQYIKFQEVIDDCPVNAISVEDETITALHGSDAVIELKTMINEKIKNYKIPYPNSEEYDFNETNYEAPSFLSQGLSKNTYKSYDKAQNEGFYAFKNTMYSQQKALIQAVCIEYKTRQLKKFAYYVKEKGNYFYDINMEISKMLEEAVLLGQYISENKVNLPSDFCDFEVGPDKGFDGDTWSWILRNLEQLDWSDKMKDEEFYKTYINVEEYDDQYKYSLYEVESTFREYIVYGLYMQLSDRVDQAIDSTYKKYCEVFKKTLNEKLSLLKTELKRCSKFDDSVETKQADLVKEINLLLGDIRSIELKKETVYHSVDWSYDSSFRFSSYSKASEAGGNRTDRFYNDCEFYLGTRHSPSISNDLSECYKNQFEAVINIFKTKLQEIFDKHDMPYPKEWLYISCGTQSKISVDISNYEDVSSNIRGDIRNFIEDKVIGWGGALRNGEYFDYSDVSYEVSESITWKQGLFGEKKVPVYNYLADFGRCYSGFNKAVSFCCDYVFESDYINSFRFNMLSSLEKEVKEKILTKFLKTV
ncbi:ferredoxin [Priestia koreensis]|uniref:ferredoxin n=1 Tax=Priestia koreensis TaxID=284581 RepID=UPI00203B0B96|nr:ferredoxin [Priestia koreensis]MCM3006322.1 ferredoxin [Priestia koreensis]